MKTSTILLATFAVTILSLSKICMAQNTVLYATTSQGGIYSGRGTIISFTPATGVENVLWSFGGSSDFEDPWGNLTYDSNNGFFYGTAYEGGDGDGGIFKFDLTGNSETIEYNSGGPLFDDASNLSGNLVYDPNNGRYYGMSYAGGGNESGTIFSFNPTNNVDSVVWSFGSGSDGSSPYGSLTYDPTNGKFYGCTYNGGANFDGTIISFDPSNNTETVLYSFGTNAHDGYQPWGDLVYDVSSNLFYGMTSGGGANEVAGIIFSFNPGNNTETILYNFAGYENNDGAEPLGDLIYDTSHKLYYGMTSAGGTQDNDAGTIFSFNPSNDSEKVIWSFTNFNVNDGSAPYGNLIYDATDGLYYGMTYGGGSNEDGGTIISFNPATGRDSVLWNFGSGNDGANPRGAFVVANGSAGINLVNSMATCVNIYPNPNNGNFNIQLQKINQQNTQLQIFNVLGQTVYTGILNSTNIQINLSSQAKGVYLYMLLDEQGNQLNEGKFVVE